MFKQTFRLRNNFILNILFTFSSFALALFGLLVLLPPAETEIATAVIDSTIYDLSIATNDSINLELTPTVDGSVAIAKDTITATTTSPSGYKLYVSSNSASDNNIHLNGDNNSTEDKTIQSTTGTFDAPVALNINNDNNIYASWGYAVAGLNNFDNTYSTTNPSSSSKFAALPTKDNEQLIHEHTGTASSDTTEIYYGVKANTNLASGNYQTEILYTTLTDTSSIVDGEATITPNNLEEDYEATIATIQTSLKTTRELGTISVTIGNQACTNITVTSESPVTLTCTIPVGLEAGEYNVEANFTRLGKTYTIANGITIILPPLSCNSSATTITDAVCMQDMNENVISSMVLEQQYQLTDSRDRKTYFIAKLQDGKVWMTQNLDLNLDSNVALTDENTDLNSVASWTPTRSTIDVTSNMTTTGTSATITGWADDYNTPYSIDPGNVYFDGTYSTSSECNYLTANCEHFKNTKQTLNNEHGHVGNYYNWSAVVASNNTESFTTSGADYPDSICPKGWRLPYGVGSSSGNDFQSLDNAYGGITNSDQTLLSTPLFFVRAGRVAPGLLYNAANTGHYWSSTVDSSDYYYAYNLYFTSDNVYPGSGSSNRYGGFSARCVARKPITIIWDANGGTVDPATTTKESGSEIGTLPTPAYDGYEFLGWFTEATGGTEISTTTIITTNITYYAHWEEMNPFDVAFANAGKSKQNGYYKMQDMTASICSAIAIPAVATTEDISTQLIDTRDNKVYWVAKLADENCWMTQNLDLNLSTNTTLTDEDTDLNSVSSWTPAHSTIDATSNMTTTGTSATITGWIDNYFAPYSADPGNVYFDGVHVTSSSCNYLATNCEHFKNTKQTLNNEHGHVGNYYNWSAAVASNNTSSYTTGDSNYPDSICPKGWRLSNNYNNENGDFFVLNGIYRGGLLSDQTLLETPLFFVRAGRISTDSLSYAGHGGNYWSSTVSPSGAAHILGLSTLKVGISVYPNGEAVRNYGISVRCIAR